MIIDGLLWVTKIISTNTTTDIVDPAAGVRVLVHHLDVFVSVAGVTANTASFQFGSTVWIPQGALLTTTVGSILSLTYESGFNLGAAADDFECKTLTGTAATLTVNCGYTLI
jgi:hypothetical protein